MKPRISLAEKELADGTTLVLQEHDGRHALISGGQQLAGPATLATEREIARLATAPFRPARQPVLWIGGLALGGLINAALEALPQKRGTFHVAEPLGELADWHRKHLPEQPWLADSRVTLQPEAGPAGLAAHAGSLPAILIHLDSSPSGPGHKPWPDDPRWLAAAYEALQNGGLLAIGGPRPFSRLSRALQRAGFQVAEHSVAASPLAKKPRLVPIWLARKGKYEH